jgi:hypothetical protein
MMLKSHGRYPFSIIDARPTYTWPGGKSLACYIANNLEIFSFGSGLGFEIGIANPPPNHRAYAWREYGNRVGLSRLLDLFDALGIPAAHNVNTLLYEYQPQLFERIRKRGDEIIGHGRTNAEKQSEMSEAEEARLIREVTDAIALNEGAPPSGWLGPWLAETYVTPDLLHEAGYTYHLDWACDDQPIWMRTRRGRILAVPYPIEINDAPAIVNRNFTARDFCDMVVDRFEEMVEESRRRPLVCGLALHPFLFGQPHRIRPLRQALKHCVEHSLKDAVWWTRPGDIARHCYALPEGTLVGA